MSDLIDRAEFFLSQCGLHGFAEAKPLIRELVAEYKKDKAAIKYYEAQLERLRQERCGE